MAKLKKCPYCGGFHRKRSAYLRCAKKHVVESWPKLPKTGRKK